MIRPIVREQSPLEVGAKFAMKNICYSGCAAPESINLVRGRVYPTGENTE